MLTLYERNLFYNEINDAGLITIITGVHEKSPVEIQQNEATTSEEKTLEMTNQSVAKYIFKNNEQATTMATKCN